MVKPHNKTIYIYKCIKLKYIIKLTDTEQSTNPPPEPSSSGHPSKSVPYAAFSKSIQQPNLVFSQLSHKYI